MSGLVIPAFENENETQDEPFLGEDVVAIPAVTDERANIPISETAERFLRAVLAKVPLDRIEELHLFSPLRQGTAETGIAVIAARVIVPDEPEAPLELQLESGADVEVDDGVEAVVEVIDASGMELAGDVIDESVVSSSEVIGADEVVASEEPDAHDDSPYADDPLPGAAEVGLDCAHELASAVADGLIIESPVPRVRHTVYTARYRLVIKGPDRGRWEMDVVDEADAPLLAVETVVRGVQRRAGEETATVRYDAAQLVRALRLTPPILP